MANDILRLTPLPSKKGVGVLDDAVRLLALDAHLSEALAQVYLASYPPDIGAATLEEARTEIDETFADGYGVLRSDASAVAVVGDEVVGAIMVVERSMWDEELDGPFIIELFVHPRSRSAGVGTTLLHHAIATCAHAGDSALSLRIGDGTSSSARRLYDRWGFATQCGV